MQQIRPEKKLDAGNEGWLKKLDAANQGLDKYYIE